MGIKRCGFCIRGVILVLVLLFLQGMVTIVFANSSDEKSSVGRRVVKVGISEFPYFTESNGDGTYRGIVAEYLVEIAKYTGWKMEYVEGSASELLKMLEDGDINIMGCMYKNDATIDLFNYAELSSGYVYSTLIAKNSSEKFLVGDYSSFKGMKVGAYKGTLTRIEDFKQFNEQNAFNVDFRTYDTPAEWSEAFQSGEIDAILTSSGNLREGEKILASFSIEPYYFAVTKGNTALTRELNDALLKISQIKPQLDNTLYKKYFEPQDDTTLNMTLAEQEFIKESPPLRVVVSPDWSPISTINKKTGEVNGICVDLLSSITQKTGLKFEYIITKTFEESFNLINSGEADLIAGIFDTPFVRKNCDVTISLPYLPTQTMLVQRKDVQLEKIDDPRIAMPYGFDYVSSFINSTVKHYSTVDECFKAVKNKEVDFSAINSLAVEQYLRQNGKGNLIFTPDLSSVYELSIAIANPIDPKLISIIDKTIYSIGEEEKQSIILVNTSINNSKVSFMSYLYSSPTEVLYIVILISLIIIVVLFFVMRMRLRLSQKVAYIGEAYRLIGEFTDEYIFEYNFDTNELSLPEKFAGLVNCGISVKKNDYKGDELENLILSFDRDNLKPRFTKEFRCTVSTGKQEWFRANCAVLYDAHKRPIKGIGKIVNIQAELTQKKVLEEKANTDALTGLYNKAYCESIVRNYFEKPGLGKTAAMLIIDFDHFKQVNDTLGHLGGDRAIVFLAETLRGIFRSDDTLGRWGGDEFLVFMENIKDKKVVIEKVQRFCEMMDTDFVHEGSTHHISVSVGITFSNNKSDYQKLFYAADEALYDVKRKTRNGYSVSE